MVDELQVLPSSFAQQRLWFLDQLVPGSPFYNLSSVLRFRAPLESEVLRAALLALANRHEVLRTTFATVDGRPVQVLSAEPRFPLDIEDLRELPAAERDGAAASRALEHAQRTFDLAKGPLARAVLFRQSRDDSTLLICMHHIIADDWSMGVLSRELVALIHAIADGRPPGLEPLPIQYGDYAVWQRQRLQGRRLEELLAYWRDKLAGLATLEVPTDRPRPPMPSFRGARVAWCVPPDLTRALREFAQEEGATLFMVLLSGFAALLGRYAGQADVAIGSPAANRDRAEVEGLIGFFVNTLVLRVDLSGAPSLRQLLRRVRATTVEALAHQELPFERLVEELAPERSLSRSPLVQVMFQLFDERSDVRGGGAPDGSAGGAGARPRGIDDRSEVADGQAPPNPREALDGGRGTAPFDLCCTGWCSGASLVGFLEYSTDLFEAATCERLLGHMIQLLRRAVGEPERPLAELPLLSDAEYVHQVETWNATARPLPDGDLVQLFRACVRRAPRALAALGAAAALTYAELEARAGALARHLQDHGAGPDARVAILLERGPRWVEAMLAVVMAGGVYVPLDEDNPPSRLALVIEDAAPSLVLTSRALAPRLPAGCPHLLLDELEPEPAEVCPVPRQPDDPLYIMYTSGSTGRPKGVVVPQRAVARLVRETDYIALAPSDRIAQASNMAFDAATFELWGALLSGASLHFVARDNLLDPGRLEALLRERAISVLFVTTALFNQVVNLRPATFGGLRVLLFGGELVDPAAVRRALRHGPPGELLHVYGPTENTTFSTWHRVEHVADDAATVPIGRPIANTTCHVVDARGQPVPVGVVGELWLGGLGLALGYLHGPALTAAHFVPDPFRRGRLYRTGDLVRSRPDGTLEFVGRVDDQVKLRGFRIELGEIEAALVAHEGVAQAIAVLREDRPGDRRLVAYVVTGAALPVPELREHLRARLPAYMEPAAIVLVDALPLTPHGKVDRAALPLPEHARPELARSYVAPTTALEAAVVELFGEVLGVHRVGVHDHFFRDLGGHSLLATQAISRLRELTLAEIPLRRLFEHPTAAELCRAIADQLQQGPHAVDEATARPATAPLSYAQRRLWFLAQLSPDSPFYNVPAALRIRGAVDDDVLERALQEIVRRHDVLRTTFAAVRGEPMQHVAPALHLALERVDLPPLSQLPRVQRDRELSSLTTEAARRPFDLEHGPLIRAAVVHLSGDEHVLLVTLHHIVSDGWSLGVLFRELAAIYRAFLHGEPCPLPALPRQYASYAEEQRAWLAGDVYRQQRAYWTEHLAGLQPLRLPLDHPRPPIATYQGARCHAAWPAELCQALRRLGAAHDCTLFMTLLAAWAVLLHRYAGQDDITVGCPIANRHRGGTEELIGFFVNTLVLRVDLAGDPSFGVLLGRVRTRALEAYAHQDLPFELLVEELRPERSLSRNPLFQVMFQLQNLPVGRDEGDEGTDAGGAGGDDDTLSPDRGTATFDLAFDLWESGPALRGLLEYSTDVFERASALRLLDHFTRLLHAAVEHPDAPISSLPLLAPEEALRQLAEDAAGDARPPIPVHLAFVARARACPEAPAVIAGERAWTYGELDARSAALAGALRARGVAPGSTVAVLLDPGPELVATFLGVLRAGCTYLALEPRLPEARQAWMARDAGASALVTLAAPGGELAGLAQLSPDQPAIPDPADPADLGDDGPADVAYVLYTSGSTGRPKGVAVTHRSLAHHAREIARRFALSPHDRVLQFASPGFDVIAEEIFPTLAAGAALVVPSNPRELSPDELVALVARDGLSVVNLPAPFWHLWVDALERSRVPLPDCLRLVVTGSDRVDPSRLRRWRELAPRARWINAYGTTECTITCCLYEADPRAEDPRPAGAVPIGRPLPGVRILVLDPRLNLVPTGVVGEICVGGPCLARGYVGRPELTARAFVPDPFHPGERLYRTGDLGRWRPDGLLEIVGRDDDQVKLRGYRIELGEIEAVLRDHPAVSDVAVVLREDRPDDRRVVAYVVQDASWSGPSDSSAHWNEEQIDRWELVYDQLYGGRTAPAAEQGFHIVGWNSSYTGQPIPAAEMRAWLDDTLARIRERPAPRILEIGCGTGMLLLALAPGCARYVGTDLSEVALADVRRQLGPTLSHVELRHQRADDFDGLDGPFDLVVLNSVVQYFPGVDYLLRVLSGVLPRVAPGGRIFLGDLRSLDLHPAFAASIELYHAPAGTPVDRVLAAVERRLVQEQELLLDPGLFLDLAHRAPQVGAVRVQLKRGGTTTNANELTSFRYDVTLDIGEPPAGEGDHENSLRWRDWRADGLDLAWLGRVLDEEAPDTLDLARIPNARVAPAALQLQRLRRADGASPVGALPPSPALAAVDPEAIWSLAEARGYHVAVFPSGDAEGALFDARLARRGAPTFRPSCRRSEPGRPASAHANNPLCGALARALTPLLHGWLAERLPDFMVPSAFVLLDALPRTPAGKLAKAELPRPDQLRPALETRYEPPQGALEEALVELWSELLGIEQIGVHDNFFTHLGGHSLLGTQLVARVREVLHLELPLHELFTRPTVRELAQLLQGADTAALAPSDALRPRRDGGPAPLSFAQQRIWFLCQLMPGTRAYNMPQAVELTGELDRRLLGRALDELVRRHAVLRTTFAAREGAPVQIVAPPRPVPIALYDLRELAPPERDARAAELLAHLAQLPLDLARGPLLRVGLIQLASDRHVLLLVVHHIVADGWSLGIIFSELSALALAYRRGLPSPLPELPLQYADYADWQRRRLDGGAVEQQLALWRERLQGIPALELPTARTHDALTAHTGSREGDTIDRELTRQVNELARQEGATLFMVLLAAFAVLLHRLSGQRDFGIGTPMVNRQHAELEPLVGLFLSTLVLRMDLEGDPTFRELLGRVKERVIEAFANSDLPFERIVEELQPERNLARNPFFQVFFNLLIAGRSEQELLGLPARSVAAGENPSPFDLTLYALEEDGYLLLSVLYKRELFDAQAVRSMLAQFAELLRSIVRDPDRRVSAQHMASAPCEPPAPASRAERVDFPVSAQGGSIADRCFAQARCHADRPAVLEPDRTWSYAELADAAARVATGLRARLGDEPQRVGLLFRKGGENIAAILGTLAAGHAYVPLDPSYPDARLRRIIDDADASVVVFDREHRAQARRASGPRAAIALATLSGGEAGPLPEVPPERVAYLMYTSGSTGHPKGISQSQHNLMAHARCYARSLGISPDDRLSLLPSCSFDASVMDIFGALLNGAALVSLDLLEEGLPAVLRRLPRVTVLHATPTLFRTLAQALDRPLPDVRAVVLGGEAAYRSDLQLFQRQFRRDAVLVNGFGPSECTLALQFHATAETTLSRPALPIGYPVEGVRVTLQNADGEEVGVGGIGEIVLGSPHLALGYWQKPEATARVFQGDADTGRRYHTGDLGRRLPDGAIEFVGRRDDQVKIRGYRIEVGEVEQALLRLPPVDKAVVVARRDDDAPYLVAYLVQAPGRALQPCELRERLSEELPGSMIPSAFVTLEQLPLLPNGKVDRAALPRPKPNQAGGTVPHVAPRTPVERRLAELWGGLLGLTGIGVHAHFFRHLGGHSLLAVQLMSRVRDHFRVELPLRLVFEAPTIEGLARAIERAGAELPDTAIPRAARQPFLAYSP